MPRASASASTVAVRAGRKTAASANNSSEPAQSSVSRSLFPPPVLKRKSTAVSTSAAGAEAGASSSGSASATKRRRNGELRLAATATGGSAAKRSRKAGPAENALPAVKAPKVPKAVKEKPEKRLARYVALPSMATNERIARAFQHRLYLIDKNLAGSDQASPSSCVFDVLGSTGNVYQVELKQRPSCSCPDFPRSGLCKHILFIMLRVLKLDRQDPRVWQKALLTSELKELLDISATTDGMLASQSVRQRFQEIQGSGKSDTEDSAPQPRQREIAGDCPICYESMEDGNGKAREPVVFCRACGNNVHKDCFERWSQSKRSSGGDTTCIYCRAVWSDGLEKVKNGRSSSAYVNLADVSEPHRNQRSSLEDLYPESFQWIGYHGGGHGRGRGRGRSRT